MIGEVVRYLMLIAKGCSEITVYVSFFRLEWKMVEVYFYCVLVGISRQETFTINETVTRYSYIVSDSWWCQDVLAWISSFT